MSRYRKEYSKGNDEANAALSALREFADIMEPKDAIQPILHPNVQKAIFEWMLEIDNADLLKSVGMEPRRTCLLYGPPGTGKTTLAHALAARLKKPLVAIASEKLVSAYLGETGRKIGMLFDLMREVENHALILFDEFDAIATKRGEDHGGGAQNEMNRAVTVILRRLEQFRGIAIAATNTDKSIDAAIWRRFGLQIEVSFPREDERFAIIKRYADPFELEDEDVDILVELTRDCSPSLLRQLVEGMKRTLVLSEKAQRDVSSPVKVFQQIVSSISPPAEMKTPPLWEGSYACEPLAKMKWPPMRRKPSDSGDGDREAA